MDGRSLTRVDDWDKRLAAATTLARRTPSVWGTSDCIMKAAAAVEAITGVDLAADMRGTYATEEEAAAVLAGMGHANVEELFIALFGEPIGRLSAQRGDVCTVDQRGAIAAGYVTESGVAVASPTGIIFVPQTQIRMAFKVARP